jgi:hypothetical protein
MVKVAETRSRSQEHRARIAASQRARWRRVNRERLMRMIVERADAEGLNGHDLLFGVEAASLLGLDAGCAAGKAHGRLYRLEALGLLRAERTPGGYRRWRAADCLALIELAREEARRT